MKYFARYSYVEKADERLKKSFESVGNVYMPHRGQTRCIIDIEGKGTIDEIEKAISEKYNVEQVDLINLSKL